jgi:DNA-binding protein HU-beta
MNKAQLIYRVRELHGNRFTAEQAVEVVFDTMVREVVENGYVAITGFGTLEAVDIGARMARNPATGHKVLVPATRKVRFRPGKSLRALMNRERFLPVEGSAIRKAPKGTLQKVSG